MLHDTPKDGGLWLRTLCRACNGLASRYDDAYGDFARGITRLGRMQSARFMMPHNGSGVPSVAVAPGRVARSVLHAMVALTPSMRLVHERFLDELLADEDIALPAGLQLRVARISHPECRISSAYWMQQMLGTRQNYDAFAEICFYPFIWVLCSPADKALGPSLVDIEQWGDATEWILFSTDVVRSDLRDVLKRLPYTVHPTLRNRDDWIEFSSGDDSYVLEGLIRP